MTDPAPLRRERALARAAQGARILARTVGGEALERIARDEEIPRRRAERLLRAELAKAFAPERAAYARLQIARHETLIARLSGEPARETLAAAPNLLRAFARLDRYHAFSDAPAAPEEPTELVKRQILDKLNRMAARSLGAATPPAP